MIDGSLVSKAYRDTYTTPTFWFSYLILPDDPVIAIAIDLWMFTYLPNLSFMGFIGDGLSSPDLTISSSLTFLANSIY